MGSTGDSTESLGFEIRVGELIRRRSLTPPGASLSPDPNRARAPIEAADHLRAALPQRRNPSLQPMSQREEHGSDRGSQPAESGSESAEYRTGRDARRTQDADHGQDEIADQGPPRTHEPGLVLGEKGADEAAFISRVREGRGLLDDRRQRRDRQQ